MPFNTSFFENFMLDAYESLAVHYDYYYLKAMHEKNRTQGCHTMIVGSSHAMNGIVETAFDEPLINLSVSSQDLYYDFLHVRKALSHMHGPIRTCLVNIGYYTLHVDLSLSQTTGCLAGQVYAPLFGDAHHYRGEDNTLLQTGGRLAKVEDAEKELIEAWAVDGMLQQGSYYGEYRSREDCNLLGVKKVDWVALSDREKLDYAAFRAGQHNKHLKRAETFEENRGILRDLVKLLNEKQIRTVFVIFPFTPQYNACIDPAYKDIIYRSLDELDSEVEFLDLNEVEGLVEAEDFLDSDHLKLSGAMKVSAFLNDYLHEDFTE